METRHTPKPLPELAFANSMNPPDMFIHRWRVFNILQVIKEQPYCQQGQSEKFASTGHLRAFLSGLGGLRQRNITQSY
jgi:hypothetical protein